MQYKYEYIHVHTYIHICVHVNLSVRGHAYELAHVQMYAHFTCSCIPTCNLSMSLRRRIPAFCISVFVCVHRHVYICVYVHIYIYMCVYIRVCFMCQSVCVRARVRGHVHVHVHVGVNVHLVCVFRRFFSHFMYLFACTHTHAHIYIYIHIYEWNVYTLFLVHSHLCLYTFHICTYRQMEAVPCKPFPRRKRSTDVYQLQSCCLHLVVVLYLRMYKYIYTYT